MLASPVTTEVTGDLEEIEMLLNPELTQALAEDHIRELHRQAARHLPVSPATARFQGLTALAGAFSRAHRHARTAATTATAAVTTAGATTGAAGTAPTQDARSAGSPVGCAA